MDPDANLKEQLELAQKLVEPVEHDHVDAVRLAELVLALDEWLEAKSTNGFLPSRWGVKALEE